MESTKMRSDWDKELRALQKWRDSTAPIKFQLVGSSFTLKGWASVARADDFEIALNLSEGSGYLAFDPSKCALQYADAKDAEESVKPTLDSRVVSAITVAFPEGIHLFMYEWRSEERSKSSVDIEIPRR